MSDLAALTYLAARRRNAASLLTATLRLHKSVASARRWLAGYRDSAPDRQRVAADALELLTQLEIAAREI